MDNNYQDRPVVATQDDLRGHRAGHGTTVVAWIALLLAVAALALAWTAFNRTGEDLEQRIQQSVNESIQATEQGAENAGDALQDTGEAVGDAAEDTGEAIDAGPDGVDEDDTDTGTTNQ